MANSVEKEKEYHALKKEHQSRLNHARSIGDTKKIAEETQYLMRLERSQMMI